jgi:photosystem II stability/assembly factor-like uncharacterized protein
LRSSIALVFAVTAAAQSWTAQTSGTTASLRGLAAVSDRVAWASGTSGTYLITTDGGATWKSAQVPGAESLDFRDVHAMDARTAWLMSAGPGDKSKIYHTTDGGAHWSLEFTNPEPSGFFDAIAFWDAKRGLVLGDPVGGRQVVLTTENWRRLDTPPALDKEGAFAASGTCLIARGDHEAWYGTTGARVFHTKDGGKTWTVSQTPVRHDSASAGIFSLAFDGPRGIAVGGDYTKPEDDSHNIAISIDGGVTWAEPANRPTGFRSAVAITPAGWIVVGTSGSDISGDSGRTWRRFDTAAYNAVAYPWAVGPKGAIARFRN